MPNQRFTADKGQLETFNGGKTAAYRNTEFDVYAKVIKCPIEGTSIVATCYATGYSIYDDGLHCSMPACMQRSNRYISGTLFVDIGFRTIVFRVDEKHKDRIPSQFWNREVGHGG